MFLYRADGIGTRLIVTPDRLSEMPISTARRSRFDAIIPEWVVEGYGWIALLITVSAIQILGVGGELVHL